MPQVLHKFARTLKRSRTSRCSTQNKVPNVAGQTIMVLQNKWEKIHIFNPILKVYHSIKQKITSLDSAKTVPVTGFHKLTFIKQNHIFSYGKITKGKILLFVTCLEQFRTARAFTRSRPSFLSSDRLLFH